MADLGGAGEPGRWRIALVMAGGLVSVSFATILIKWTPAPALAIATWRLLIAGLVMLLIARTSGLAYLRARGRAFWGIALLSGLCLAVHFAAWISSLERTSLTSSVVLMSTAPFQVALGSWLVLRQPVSRWLPVAMLVVLAGILLIALHARGARADTLSGNLLAFLGGLGYAGYLLCGRAVRRHSSTAAYVIVAYLSGGIALLIVSAASGTQLTGFPASVLGMLLLIALIPQLLGHTAFNWGLRYLGAPLVATVALGEPVVTTILAVVLLPAHETALGMQQGVGCLLVLAGVGLAIWSER